MKKNVTYLSIAVTQKNRLISSTKITFKSNFFPLHCNTVVIHLFSISFVINILTMVSAVVTARIVVGNVTHKPTYQ